VADLRAWRIGVNVGYRAVAGACRGRRAVGACVLLTILIGTADGCGSSSGSSAGQPNSSGSSLDPALAQALRFAPSVNRSASYEISFTDWARIESNGSFQLSASPTSAEQGAFVTRLSNTGVPFGPGFEPTMLWPFRSLSWEASFLTNGAPLDVEGFRPSFAVSHISGRLQSCGFTPSRVSNFVIYVGSPAQVEKCAGQFGNGLPGIDSVYALDAANRVLVMSTTVPAVRAAITGGGVSTSSGPLAAVLAPLSADPVLEIELGNSYCKLLTARVAGLHATPHATSAALRADPAGAPYPALGIGYNIAQRPPRARIVIDYGDARTASTQLPVRERLLKTDTSFVISAPYSNYLSLESATTQAGNVVLSVKPASGNQLTLGEMSAHSDLAFARC
jgi:hypothetical protein